MLNACVRNRSDHTPCRLLLYLRCYLELRDISSSKQEVAKHVIRHPNVMRQDCRPKTKLCIFTIAQTMTEAAKAKGRGFAKFLESLPEDARARGNEENFRAAEAEHQRFLEYFSKGHCYLCKNPLASFSKKTPCPHWLLKPKGFKKNDLLAIAHRYGFFQIQSFLRWVANQDSFARNINDLPDEGSGSKLFEVTIKYKNLEWAFSCAESDYQGHATSQHAKHQHYHFQMRIDQRPFINYSDFHVPFSEMDVINIEAMRALPGKVKQRFSFGEGMNDALNEDTVEQIVSATVPGDASDEAPFKIDTIAMAEEGKTISGDDLYEIIQEAKAKNVTVASLMHKLPNAQTRVIVTPGPGVVEQAPRSGRKKDA